MSSPAGQILDGKYLIGRIIGSGAGSIVYEAKNVERGEKVAIKCPRPELAVESAVAARFAREAKATAAIKSEYVATVFDVGTTPEGMPFMVMEYLDGKDLGSVVEESGPLGARTAVEYALQVCEALAVAHAKAIVHRDIKPENLLLTERAGGMKIVKVLDFGISKAALTGAIGKSAVGTPLYMSPEQVRATDSVDVRSDVWSLGMVIYEMLTGHPAFDGQSITEICAQIIEAEPRPIEMFRNDLPSGLVEAIAKCLQKDVTKRYQNIAEVALALMPFGPKRTRLNVERAVAALQGAGHIGSDVRMNSTMPPSPADFMYTPIPKAPATPSDGFAPIASSSSSLPVGAPSAPLSSPASGAVSAYQPPPEQSTSFGIILGVLAVLAVLVGGIAAIHRGSGAPAAPPPQAAETKVAPPEAKAATHAAPTGEPTAEPSATHVPRRPAPVGTASAPPRPATSAKPPSTVEEPDTGY